MKESAKKSLVGNSVLDLMSFLDEASKREDSASYNGIKSGENVFNIKVATTVMKDEIGIVKNSPAAEVFHDDLLDDLIEDEFVAHAVVMVHEVEAQFEKDGFGEKYRFCPLKLEEAAKSGIDLSDYLDLNKFFNKYIEYFLMVATKANRVPSGEYKRIGAVDICNVNRMRFWQDLALYINIYKTDNSILNI